MKHECLVWVLLISAALTGCGGGGGGGDTSSASQSGGGGGGVTLSITAFSAGNALNSPRHMVFHAGDLYVANQGGNNVLKIDSQGGQAVHLTGITSPIGLTTDGADFYVSGTVAGTGQGIYPFTVGGGALRAQIALCNCYGLVATSTALASGGRLYSVNQSTNVVNVFTSAGLRASPAVADKPTGLAIYSNTVYVTRHDATLTAPMSKVNASDSASDFLSANALFNNPNGIAINPVNGDMYVVNEGTAGASSILKVTSAGVVSQFLSAADGLCSATGVAISGNALYVSNGVCASGTTAETRNYILKVSPI